MWFGRIHQDDVQNVKDAYKALFEEGWRFDIEYRIKRKDGKWIWLHDRAITTYEKDGVMYADGIFADVSERKKMEEELKHSEQTFRTIFDNAADGILLADAESKKFYTGNKMICQMLGHNIEEIKSMGVTDIHPEEHLPYVIEQFERQRRGEFTLARDIPVKRKDGSVFYADINSFSITLAGRAYLMGIFRDITERKKAEEELLQYRERMSRAEQIASIGTLSASMAHKLTQPLTVITLSIERALAKLEKMSCPAAVKEGLKDALSGASQATSIVNGFRNYARKSSERIAKKVNLKTVAEKTVRLLSEKACQARVALRLKGMNKVPTVYLVEEDIEHLFFALAENAIQAADGKKNRQFVISGTVRDKYIELEFSDDCGGIVPENLDRIFEPFFTTRPEGERTGLGLCIVQSIVSQAGGKIRVENKPGKGSTLFVTLPVDETKGAKLSSNER